MTTAVVFLGPSGLETACRIAATLPDALVHGKEGAEGAEVTFSDTLEHVRDLFRSGTTIVGVCASAILIRALAPVLSDKWAEPPVLAVAEGGSVVVPLLGGHHGANRLARDLARALGGVAAVTTASDVRFGVAVDEPPVGVRLANPEHVKAFAASLLAGAAVRMETDLPWLEGLPVAADGALSVVLTEEAMEGRPDRLVYHPRCLAVGVGCERDTEPAELVALVTETLRARELAPGAVGVVASLDLKADEAAVHAVAAALDVPARFFPAATLEAETYRLATPSEVVFREVGCHGVAEGAALAAVGREGHLVVAKTRSARATCAVAWAPESLDAAVIGQARGRLFVVGTGPGTPDWRHPETARLVSEATDLVGYGLYLDLLGPLAHGKWRHGYELGEEEKRVRMALDLAGEGRTVALVSSGDPGVYAMATLVFELLHRDPSPSWRRIEIRVSPGISAMQAAAARIGAPLGHDFCAISLSDLLTPWEAIEKRLRAAAESDFVVSFYNPVSRRRTTQLARAREILLKHRPPDTPVVLARNLGRDGEMVRVVTLAELDPADVDMLTLVMVGASSTRRVGPWVYTPRGYEGKTT